MVLSALKEAQSTKSFLANIWLDIANACGSIPHRLLLFACESYGVDPLSKYTIFLSLPQVVPISISREFLVDPLCQ